MRELKKNKFHSHSDEITMFYGDAVWLQTRRKMFFQKKERKKGKYKRNFNNNLCARKNSH
jgi:23S rRNA maturation mini-RNase III